tara:strand:- start:5909 stop:6634 length:726 start_codon:yes stop_codon:yes gene_type:complete
MDLGPTVMSLLNIEPPMYMDGKSFAGKFEKPPRQYIFGSADRFDESTDMQRSVLDGRFVYIRNFMPELPLIYRNKYREQITMNKLLIDLNQNGDLQGDASYIFMSKKPTEELYDLNSDPYEVNNLAKNKDFKYKLLELRKQLENWQIEVDDRGFTPESKIINEFWPNMIQPVTSDVSIDISNHEISLNCNTEGASIGYQTDEKIGTNYWQLYSKPLKLEKIEKIRARAIRIGYKASRITSN